MRKSAVAMPFFALIAGAVGALVRRMEVNTVLDSATGLARKNAQVTLILIVLSAMVLIVVTAFSTLAGYKHKAEADYVQAFAHNGFSYLAASALIAAIWLAGAALYLAQMSAGGALTAVGIVYSLLAALTAAAFFLMARGAYKGRVGSEMVLFSVIPPVFFCFWLILLYKDNAVNPVLLSYAYPCLAIAAAALSTYFAAGFVFRKTVTCRMIFFTLVAVYFCTVALSDPAPLPLRIFFGAAAAHAFINAVVFIKNLRRLGSA